MPNHMSVELCPGKASEGLYAKLCECKVVSRKAECRVVCQGM